GVGTAGTAFTSGLYYIKLQGMNADGSAQVSEERRVSVGLNQYLLVTFPSAAKFVTWRVYIGASSGKESFYVSSSGSVTSVSITNASSTTVGTPAAGGGALS